MVEGISAIRKVLMNYPKFYPATSISLLIIAFDKSVNNLASAPLNKRHMKFTPKLQKPERESIPFPRAYR